MKTIIIIPLFLAVLVTAITNSIYDFKDVNNDPVKAVELPDGKVIYDPDTNPYVLDAVKEIRHRFKEEYELHPELYIQDDVDLINREDFFVRRFLFYQQNGRRICIQGVQTSSSDEKDRD